MYCQAYVKDDRLFVNFNKMSIVYDGLNFQLGDAATNFSALPEGLYKAILEKFKDAFLDLFSNLTTYDTTFEVMKTFTVALSEINPYFNFYMDNFIMYLMLLHGYEQRELIPVLAKSFLIDGGRDANLKGTDIINPTTAANSGVEVFSNDIKKRQTRLKEDFAAIIGNSEEFTGLNPMQRLYLLSKQGRNYLSGEFQTTLAPDYQSMPDDLDEIKTTLLKNKVDVVEMVGIETLDDLLGFELYHALKTELPLRKCKHCGEYFIVRGRIDTEYCDRQKPGESKPCSIIGATRNYWESKSDDPIYVEFQKAYKRNHSRQRVGKMTQNEFYEWSEEARKKRSDCDAGLLSLDEFRLWLGNKR